MPRIALPLAALAALLAAPAAAPAKDPRTFQSPSRNIACALEQTRLRCDMRQLGNRAAPRPDDCEFDYGRAFAINRWGARGERLCVSDAVGGPGTPVVRYGETWRRGGFQCRIRRRGVRCTNQLRHGFFLRRGLQFLF